MGDVESLKMITNEERQSIKMVNTVQKDLLNHAKDFLEQHSISMDTPTLQDCLPYVKKHENQTLTKIQSQLVEKDSLLKNQNDLNHGSRLGGGVFAHDILAQQIDIPYHQCAGSKIVSALGAYHSFGLSMAVISFTAHFCRKKG